MYVVSALLIVAVAMLVAVPLLAPDSPPTGRLPDTEAERLEREKAAALLAIREAQLDKAMGKLSDEDYAALRAFYERRAISAMTGLDGAAAASRAACAATDRCAACGSQVTDDSPFCAHCGSPGAQAEL
jgi:hypothetical protein